MFSLYAALSLLPSDKVEVLRSDSKEKIRNWMAKNKEGAVEISEFSWTLDKGYVIYFWIENRNILVI